MEVIRDGKNIMMVFTMPGIVFQGEKGKKVLVTAVDVPEEIATFISKKDYGLLLLSGFPANGPPSVK